MSAYSSYILSLGPAGYWRVDEATGAVTAVDSSGSGRNGTYTNAGGGSIIYGAPGAIPADPDTAVHVAGYYVDVPHDASINTATSFSFMGWIDITQADYNVFNALYDGMGVTRSYIVNDSGWELLAFNSFGQPYYLFRMMDGAGNFVANIHSATSTYALNQWHQVCGTFDSTVGTHGQATLYVDGAQVAQANLSAAYSAGAHDLFMGFVPTGLNYPMALDELAYWTRKLTATEVSNAFTTGTAPGAGKVSVGGQQVNVYAGTLNVNQQIGQRGTGGVELWTAPGLMWTYGTRVQVYDGNGNNVYSGYVAEDTATRKSYQGNGYLDHSITLMDNAYRADKRLITASYLNQTADFIVNDIINNYLAAEGVITNSSVAAGILIPEKIWVLEKASAALDWLAEQCGFWWSIDVNGVLWFQPYTGRPSGVSIDGSTLSNDETMRVKRGNSQFRTKQWVKGGYDKTPLRSESFIGDGTRQTFTLAYQVSEMQSVTRNGVLQSLGTKSVDTGKNWYFAVGDAQIAQDQSGTPLSSAETLTVNYKGKYPILAAATSPGLIASQAALEGGGTGIVESVQSDNKIFTLTGALQVATNLLNKYGSDMITLDYLTHSTTLIPGLGFTATLADWGISSHTFLVTEVSMLDSPDAGVSLWYHVSAVGSPYQPAQHQPFWRKLMAQRPDTDFIVPATVVTVSIVVNGLESDSVLAVAAQVVAPSGKDPLIANSILKGP